MKNDSRTGSGFGVWGQAMDVPPGFPFSRSLVQSSQNHVPVPCILTAHALTRPDLTSSEELLDRQANGLRDGSQ